MDLLIVELINGLVLTFIVFISLVLTVSLAGITFYMYVLFSRLKKREKQSLQMVTLEVKVPRDNDIKIDAAEQLFASFAGLSRKKGWDGLFDVGDTIAFEIVGTKGKVGFYISAPAKMRDLIEKQVYAFYPSSSIELVEEPHIFTEQGKVAYAALRLKKPDFQPLKVYRDLPTDSLSTITSSLSKMSDNEGAIIQILIRATHSEYKKAGRSFMADAKKKEADPEKATFKVDQKDLERINDKISKPGYDVEIRLVTSAATKDDAESHLRNLEASYGQFSSEQNNFTKVKLLNKYAFMISFVYKFFPIIDNPIKKYYSTSVLSSDELATLFHFPNKTIETPFITWLGARSAPVDAKVPTEGGTYIGHGHYRGVRRPIHILRGDRRRHVYIIGKTGVGKSELLLDMAVQDIRNGDGVCVIDPHGDLVEKILRYIPPERAEDVIYFDPSDTERPMGLNLLEARTEDEKHFMTTSIINLMYKLYDPQRTGIVGPRFEHSVRNAMLTVMTEPGNTFIEIVRILTDPSYVKELLPKVQDPIVRRFWTDQIEQTSDFHKSETLDYIVSKFGRFVTNATVRNIIGQSKSAFDFRQVMDTQKILLINLSKGRLGEENSSFLGLVIIPKILVAAMSRQEIPEDDRKDFYLYVDEFQNFATPDFATILSEARKYRLGLTVANQFIGQMDEDVKNAVIGNVGSLISFRLGTTDASFIAREFQPTFNDQDLQNVERYHAYMKTIVDNDPVPAFSVDMTKDMAKLKAEANERLAQAVVELSRLKYGRDRAQVEKETIERSNL